MKTTKQIMSMAGYVMAVALVALLINLQSAIELITK